MINRIGGGGFVWECLEVFLFIGIGKGKVSIVVKVFIGAGICKFRVGY